MLLGSFVEEFDKKNDEPEDPSPISPGNGAAIHESPPRLFQPGVNQPWPQIHSPPPAELPTPEYGRFHFTHRPSNNQIDTVPARPESWWYQRSYPP